MIIKYLIRLNEVKNNVLSFFMKAFLRLNGASIGKRTYISISSQIASSKLVIGNDCRILSHVKIKASSATFGNSVVISSSAFISGKASVTIGDMTYLGKNTKVDLSRDVSIGENVGFGENSVIWTHGYYPPYDEGYPVTFAPVKIGDFTWISTNIIILPGITIGEKVIVGAGSVVTKSVENGKIIAGNPAKIIKETNSILHTKSFVEVMEEVLDTFNASSFRNKTVTENSLIFEYYKFNIYVTVGENIIAKNVLKNRENIVFFKNCSEAYLNEFKNIDWFNFDTRISVSNNNPVTKKLRNFLRGFGIRYKVL